jgi:hypothetical protein
MFEASRSRLNLPEPLSTDLSKAGVGPPALPLLIPFFGGFRENDLRRCDCCSSWLPFGQFDPILVVDDAVGTVRALAFERCRSCRAVEFPLLDLSEGLPA